MQQASLNPALPSYVHIDSGLTLFVGPVLSPNPKLLTCHEWQLLLLGGSIVDWIALEDKKRVDWIDDHKK